MDEVVIFVIVKVLVRIRSCWYYYILVKFEVNNGLGWDICYCKGIGEN